MHPRPGRLVPPIRQHWRCHCRQREIGLIIPTIDTELPIYAAQIELFKNSGIEVLVPSIDFVQMTRNKIDTAKYLNQIGIRTPKTWTSLEEKEEFTYPLVAKPVDGSCSVGLAILENERELERLSRNHYEYMFQEKCSGEEYTVNAYYEGGCFRCAVPHHRVKTRSGEVLFGETVRTPVLEDIAAKLANGPLAVNGVICFQAFCTENANVANVIEINSRFGGGYPLCDQAGGTFARWILQKNATGKSDANNMDWKSGVRMLRYDAAVFYDRHESRANAFCS